MFVESIRSMDGMHRKDFMQILSLLALPTDGPQTPDYEDLAYTLSQGGVLFIARPKKRSAILGVATLFLVYTVGRREGLIMHITVPEQYRGNKVGVHLLQSMEQYARSHRVRRLRLLHPRMDPLAEKVFRDHQFISANGTELYEKLL